MSGAGKEEKKPEQDERIILKVKNQYENEVFFEIKRDTHLKKLMTLYCDRQSVEHHYFRFLFDGQRLHGDQTPAELELEDGDEIDAMNEQDGG